MLRVSVEQGPGRETGGPVRAGRTHAKKGQQHNLCNSPFSAEALRKNQMKEHSSVIVFRHNCQVMVVKLLIWLKSDAQMHGKNSAKRGFFTANRKKTSLRPRKGLCLTVLSSVFEEALQLFSRSASTVLSYDLSLG